MKRKLIDPPTRWGYYLIGIAAGFGVTAGLLQSPIGMFILLPALPLLCIILALVFTLRQRAAHGGCALTTAAIAWHGRSISTVVCCRA